MFVKLLSPQSLRQRHGNCTRGDLQLVGQRHGNCTRGDLQLIYRMNLKADDHLKRKKGNVVFYIDVYDR